MFLSSNSAMADFDIVNRTLRIENTELRYQMLTETRTTSKKQNNTYPQLKVCFSNSLRFNLTTQFLRFNINHICFALDLSVEVVIHISILIVTWSELHTRRSEPL